MGGGVNGGDRRNILGDTYQAQLAREHGLPDNLLGNWPEDFAGENGRYYHVCPKCRSAFVGHKRRTLCKTCEKPEPAALPTPAPVGPSEAQRKSIGDAELSAGSGEAAALRAAAGAFRNAINNDVFQLAVHLNDVIAVAEEWAVALARQADVAADRLDSVRAARGQEFANGVNAIMNMQRKIADLEDLAVALEEQTQGIVAALRAERGGAEALARDAGRALRTLTFRARTSGGTAGPDAGLMAACDAAEAQLTRPELSALIDGIRGSASDEPR